MKKLLLIAILLTFSISAVCAQQTVKIASSHQKIEYDDDKTANNKEYFGWTAPGRATSDDTWKIMRIEYSGNDFTVEYADGNFKYDNVWDDRATTVTYE